MRHIFLSICMIFCAAEARISFKNITPLREDFFIIWYTADKDVIAEIPYKFLHGYNDIVVEPPSGARFFMIYSKDISNNRLTADLVRILDGKQYTITVNVAGDRLIMRTWPPTSYAP